MNVGFYATRIQADVMKERDEIESAYDRFPDAALFWCMIDLAGSSNYRIAHGPKDGYTRGETFFSLVSTVTTRCSDVRLIKEMGDAVFLASSTFRPLLESIILVDQVAHLLAFIAGTQQFPFKIRAAIGFGVAKRLTRRHEDYLGSPIDQLSRIMGLRSDASNLFLHEESYRPSSEILQEYKDFLSVSESKMLTSEKSKGMLKPIFYRELLVSRKELAEFRDHFVPWR